MNPHCYTRSFKDAVIFEEYNGAFQYRATFWVESSRRRFYTSNPQNSVSKKKRLHGSFTATTNVYNLPKNWMI